jgi:hypothetical protein
MLPSEPYAQLYKCGENKMIYYSLELSKSLAAQQQILLEKLDGWNSKRLEDNLESLSNKKIIRMRSKKSESRAISLVKLTEVDIQPIMVTLTDEERSLIETLKTFLPHY